MNRIHASLSLSLALGLLGTALLGAGCTGDDGATGPQGPPGNSGTSTDLSQGDDLPGLDVAIQSLTGGTASGGRFKVGDELKLNFRLQKSDGSDWDIAELTSGRALVSGPSFNYQRVIAEQTDLLTASVKQSDGSYTYTFTSPVPATYLAPFNDSASFGPEDGELTGQALLEGTYTVGLTFGWDSRSTALPARRRQRHARLRARQLGRGEPRQVVKIENCNRRHDQLAHPRRPARGKSRCACSATPPAPRDNNDPAVAGGTPGVSIDFKVMIHKIHSRAPAVRTGRDDQARRLTRLHVRAEALRGRGRLGSRLLGRALPGLAALADPDAARPGLLGALRGRSGHRGQDPHRAVELRRVPRRPGRHRAADRARAGRPRQDPALASGLRCVPRRRELGSPLHLQRADHGRPGEQRQLQAVPLAQRQPAGRVRGAPAPARGPELRHRGQPERHRPGRGRHERRRRDLRSWREDGDHVRPRRRRGHGHRAGLDLEPLGGDLGADRQLQPAPEHHHPDRGPGRPAAVHREPADAGEPGTAGGLERRAPVPSPAPSRRTGT